MAGTIGFEPITDQLTADCSTVELRSQFYSVLWYPREDLNSQLIDS